MSVWKKTIYKTGLNMMYYTGVHHVLAPMSKGVGLIVMLHRVLPARDDIYQPNRHLEIDPKFLESVIMRFIEHGLDFVDLDEAHRRLVGEGSDRRFVAFTLDDGYRDNIDNARPIFDRFKVPYTIYISSGIIDRQVELWWVALDQIIGERDQLELDFDDMRLTLDCQSPEDKLNAYRIVNEWLTAIDEYRQRAVTRALADRYGVDLHAVCDDIVMTWDDVRELAADPLAMIGGHTTSHYALAKLSKQAALDEIEGGQARIEEEIGIRPAHFAYPYGYPQAAGRREFFLAREFGFKTAVTTRPGVLFTSHRRHLTALPRVNLSGQYRSIRYLDVLASGSPFAVKNGFRRIDAA